MALGALIVTTGLTENAGVAFLLNAYDQYCSAIRQEADSLYRELFQTILD